MRLPVEAFARRIALALILPAVLTGCAAVDGSYGDIKTAAQQATGAAADYSASHHTLPLPSYAEVTSLESGRTILVRVERRGPLGDHALIALSPAALDQLGASEGEFVRVRRVNPPEEECAFLRAGRSAPLRMDTPEALLSVLKRKLPQDGGTTTPAALAQVDLPPGTAAARSPPAQPPVSAPQATSKPPEQAATTPTGADVVQAMALSSRDRAERVASAIGGSVSRAGKFYRVRTGPFATHSQAEASLAKVRAAGYSDARIFTNG